MTQPRRVLSGTFIVSCVAAFIVLAVLYLVGTATMKSVQAAPIGQVSIRAVHASPDAGPVDVYVNGTQVITGVTFFNASPYLGPFPPGAFRVQVVPTGGNPATSSAISTTVLLLTPGTDYSIVANGTVAAGPAPLAANVVVDDSENAPAQGQARLRVAHFAPGASAVDILVNGERLIADLAFRQTTGYLGLAPGDYTIAVAPTGGTPIYTTTATLAAGQVVTAWANGIVGQSGAQAFKVTPTVDRAFAAAGQFNLGFIHAVPGVGPVDVYVGGQKINGPDGIDYGFTTSEFEYFGPLNAGSAAVQIVPAGEPLTGTVLLSQTLTFAADQEYTLVASGVVSGTTSNLNLDLLTDDNSAPDFKTTRVRVAHFSPTTPAVDVFVGNTKVLTNVTYRNVSPYLDLPVSGASQPLVVGVGAAGAPTPLITTTVNVSPGVVQTIAAIGLFPTGTTPPEAVVRLIQVEQARYERAQVRFLHGAPGPNVDIYARGTNAGIQDRQLLAENLQFGSFTEYLELTSDLPVIEIRRAGTATVLGTLDLSGAGFEQFFRSDGYYTLAATGIVNPATAAEPSADPPFVVRVLRDDSTTPPAAGRAKVRVAHFAPNVPSPSNTTVDIRSGGNVLFGGVAYGSVTDYIEVPSGPISVTLTPAGASSPAIPIQFNLVPDSVNTVYALGLLGPGIPANLALRALPLADAETVQTLYLPIVRR